MKVDPSGLPVWERPDLFLPVVGNQFGYVSLRDRKTHEVSSEEDLRRELRKDHEENIHLVWLPRMTHMDVPEAVTELFEQVKESRVRSRMLTVVDEAGKLKWGGIFLAAYSLYSIYGMYGASPGASVAQLLMAWLSSSAFTIGLLMFAMFAAFPWYDGRKRWREATQWTEEGMREAGRLVRFESWLEGQKIIVTRVLFGLLGIVFVGQLLSKQPNAAALSSDYADERWRLLSAPLLHGNALHFIMNAMGLLYLGRRIEALARWPHVILVFVFSAWFGGECSLWRLKQLDEPSSALGASGGLMGMLGFLLVFETFHRRLVPRSARRRLVAAMISTAVIGIIGIQFIDNAAHLGGLIAGMLYAVAVFPKSDSVIRPKVMAPERYLAAAAFCLLLLGAWNAFVKMF
jgi:membrane associated rhomboid family serine protease